jgi:hypothetical protein
VVWLAPVDDARASTALALPGGGGALVCHACYAGDVVKVKELLEQLTDNLDLTEPFARIREAIGEARKMGVAGRAA